MAQLRHEPDLAQEPFCRDRRAELGMEHLEHDRAVVLQVPRQVDGGGAAAAQLPFDRVLLGECCADPLEV